MPDCSPAEAPDDNPRQIANAVIKRRFILSDSPPHLTNSQPSERVPCFSSADVWNPQLVQVIGLEAARRSRARKTQIHPSRQRFVSRKTPVALQQEK
jgi:hypothetical protein